jgi:hypothetical protein
MKTIVVVSTLAALLLCVVVTVNGFSIPTTRLVSSKSIRIVVDQSKQPSSTSNVVTTVTYLFTAADDIPFYDPFYDDFESTVVGDVFDDNDEIDEEFRREIMEKTFSDVNKSKSKSKKMKVGTSASKSALEEEGEDSSSSLGRQTYRMGGNSKYTHPVVVPSHLLEHGEDEEDCESPYIDHATGDELCWGVEPTNMPKNVVVTAVDTPTFTGKVSSKYASPDTVDLYHKGGNANPHFTYEAMNTPHHHPTTSYSSENDGEEDCEIPFVDFATGDELCWPHLD